MDATTKLIVSFRGIKLELPVTPELTVGDVKSSVASDENLEMSDVKLMFKGKVLLNDDASIVSISNKKTLRFMATGVSGSEQASNQEEFDQALKNAPRIRDDLTKGGQAELRRRQRMGRALNTAKNSARSAPQYGFGRIEILPNLPEEAKARELLDTLANDPGVLACMAKHEWNVGSLAELYPEGKVGESAVCVMGLNKNKGQQILLRLRTDDLKGFRKMLNIRKVLFHELAHNVHSEHDDKFFQLMRQIERECNEMDWTGGSGVSRNDDAMDYSLYEGGSYRLGGTIQESRTLTARELAARAAMSRLTTEEEQIYSSCGCQQAKFLPPAKHEPREEEHDE